MRIAGGYVISGRTRAWRATRRERRPSAAAVQPEDLGVGLELLGVLDELERAHVVAVRDLEHDAPELVPRRLVAVQRGAASPPGRPRPRRRRRRRRPSALGRRRGWRVAWCRVHPPSPPRRRQGPGRTRRPIHRGRGRLASGSPKNTVYPCACGPRNGRASPASSAGCRRVRRLCARRDAVRAPASAPSAAARAWPRRRRRPRGGAAARRAGRRQNHGAAVDIWRWRWRIREICAGSAPASAAAAPSARSAAALAARAARAAPPLRPRRRGLHLGLGGGGALDRRVRARRRRERAVEHARSPGRRRRAARGRARGERGRARPRPAAG